MPLAPTSLCKPPRADLADPAGAARPVTTMDEPDSYEPDTFYGMTVSTRGHRFARREDVRASLLREIRRHRDNPGLASPQQRRALAEAAMADHDFMARCANQVMAATARDVVSAWYDGRWQSEPALVGEAE